MELTQKIIRAGCKFRPYFYTAQNGHTGFFGMVVFSYVLRKGGDRDVLTAVICP